MWREAEGEWERQVGKVMSQSVLGSLVGVSAEGEATSVHSV